MEVSTLKYSGPIGLHGRPALLRLQSDERLIGYTRKGNTAAFEVLVARYETRLLAFCRHLLGSREDAEDVLQEVMAAAFNAILADERAINVRPWLYRIARNRSLNHLRRARAIATDTMDAHFSDHGATTADKVGEREEFRLLVGDIHELPETQKTALVLREMDALSYEQIAEAMETTVPSVKSLLVRARVSLAEAAEARLLSCDEVRIELGEVAEGLRRRPGALVRRHLRSCDRCSVFRSQLRHTNKALAALMPIGPFVILKKLAFIHLFSHGASSAASHAGAASATSAGAAGAGAAGAGAAGAGLAAGSTALAGSSVAASGGVLSAGLGAIAGKAAAGLAAAAIVTAGAVEADHAPVVRHHHATPVAVVTPSAPATPAAVTPIAAVPQPRSSDATTRHTKLGPAAGTAKAKLKTTTTTSTTATTTNLNATTGTPVNGKASPTGRSQTTTDPTVLATPTSPAPAASTTPASPPPSDASSGSGGSTSSSSPPPSTTGTTTTTTSPTTTTTTTTSSTTTTTTTTDPAASTTTSATTPPPSSTDGPQAPLNIVISVP